MYSNWDSGAEKPEGLEIDEIFNRRAQPLGDAAKKIDSDADFARFDLPKVGLIGVDHERELALREILLFTQLANGVSKRDSMFVAFHRPRLGAWSARLIY